MIHFIGKRTHLQSLLRKHIFTKLLMSEKKHTQKKPKDKQPRGKTQDNITHTEHESFYTSAVYRRHFFDIFVSGGAGVCVPVTFQYFPSPRIDTTDACLLLYMPLSLLAWLRAMSEWFRQALRENLLCFWKWIFLFLDGCLSICIWNMSKCTQRRCRAVWYLHTAH